MLIYLSQTAILKIKLFTKLLWSSGIGTTARVSVSGFESWPLRNLHMGCSIRNRRSLHGKPPGDFRVHAHFGL